MLNIYTVFYVDSIDPNLAAGGRIVQLIKKYLILNRIQSLETCLYHLNYM